MVMVVAELMDFGWIDVCKVVGPRLFVEKPSRD